MRARTQPPNAGRARLGRAARARARLVRRLRRRASGVASEDAGVGARRRPSIADCVGRRLTFAARVARGRRRRATGPDQRVVRRRSGGAARPPHERDGAARRRRGRRDRSRGGGRRRGPRAPVFESLVQTRRSVQQIARRAPDDSACSTQARRRPGGTSKSQEILPRQMTIATRDGAKSPSLLETARRHGSSSLLRLPELHQRQAPTRSDRPPSRWRCPRSSLAVDRLAGFARSRAVLFASTLGRSDRRRPPVGDPPRPGGARAERRRDWLRSRRCRFAPRAGGGRSTLRLWPRRAAVRRLVARHPQSGHWWRRRVRWCRHARGAHPAREAPPAWRRQRVPFVPMARLILDGSPPPLGGPLAVLGRRRTARRAVGGRRASPMRRAVESRRRSAYWSTLNGPRDAHAARGDACAHAASHAIGKDSRRWRRASSVAVRLPAASCAAYALHPRRHQMDRARRDRSRHWKAWPDVAFVPVSAVPTRRADEDRRRSRGSADIARLRRRASRRSAHIA